MADAHTKRSPNRLAKETSPYLLQHAYNPVDWYPWGEEALSRARDLNRPIFLSIGYSACHWCHVMERESFEDEQVAAVLNEHFVSIKVDREERPDLDEIYMQATLALNQGQGGWPMSVFLTPEQQPIFAGTYFPSSDRWGRPGFITILRKVAELWRANPEALRRQAGHLTEQLRESLYPAAPTAVGEAEMDAAVMQFAEDFDPRYGGFGSAPKFPPATGLSFLLRRYHRTREAQTLHMVRKTLDGMAAGGMYDQIGGGFARYSTDERWLVPHFEKMLYDNALLARTYLEAFQVTSEPEYRRIVTETLDYVLREMTSLEGGFYSATDADSEGVEGKFFVWTPEEIRAVVPTEEEARRFCTYYDITPGGNWVEPHTPKDQRPVSIPNVPRPLSEVARELEITPEELRSSIVRLRPLVYEARRKRVPPGLDDKIIVAWNGMMLSAMAEGARVLGDRGYLAAAARAADFLLTRLSRPDGALFRTYRAGQSRAAGCLEDYAFLAEGLIDLYEAGGSERYLHEAVRLAERILADFSDPQNGGFFTTAMDHESLIIRSREGPDGATPSGNAVAASVLARLSFHYGREDFRQAAADAIRAHGRQISRHPRAFAKSLIIADLLLYGPVELAFVGTPGEPGSEALWLETGRQFVPRRIIAHKDPAEPASTHPLLAGKALVNGKAVLYVCRNFACQAPITDPAQIAPSLTAATLDTTSEQARLKTLTSARVPGHATPGGTGGYAVGMVSRPGSQVNAGQGYTRFGSTGLTTCRLGFGGYRIEASEPEHRAALVKALQEGCNLIDTSTNYTDGESERMIGATLADFIKKGELTREQIIVVSKVGYVQGQHLKRAQAREQAGRPYPEMVKYGDAIWHCLHPEFLADQLDLSLDRLGLHTLDVCLLHNPEYFLSDAKHRAETSKEPLDLPRLREEFYRRLEGAFAYFETQVQAGRLRFYGVSSNTCTADALNPEATSLSHMLDAATRAAARADSGGRHFAVLQCPMNLFESGALLTPNTGPDARLTVLELAQREGLAVLVNRPLNAIPAQGSAMVRLAELPLDPPGPTFEEQCRIVRELEEEYRREITPAIPHSGQGLAPQEFFRWADELGSVRSRVQNLPHWQQIENQMIAPHLNQVLQAISRLLTESAGEQWETWRDRYVPEFLTLLRVLRREATLKSRETTDALTKRLDPLLPDEQRQESLSRKALWVLASTPGVTCVLNGMRTPAYVADSLGILYWDPLKDVRPIFEAFARRA
jgi:hypothetical protein